MEKPKDKIKQEKQKMAISMGGGRGGGGGGGGGGGVGGVLVWGGVVAIATLVSVISAIKLRNKRLPNKTNHHHHPPQPQPIPITTDACNQLEVNNDNSSNDDQGKGLLVLLQDNSSPPPDYHPSGDGIKDASPTQIDSTPLDTSKSLILDIDTMLEITRPKEKPNYLDIVLGDNPKPKNSSLGTDYGVNKQDYSLVAEEKAIENKVLQSDQFEEELPKIQSMGQGGGEEEEQENGAEIVSEVTETFQIDPFAVQFNQEVFKVMTEDEAVRAPDAPQFGAEDDIKKMQLIGKEGEQEDGDNIADTVERVIETTQKDQFAVEFNPEEIQVMKEDEVTGAPDSPQTEAEDPPQMQLVVKEQENGENIVEVVEELVKTAQKVHFTMEINREAIQVKEEEKTIDSARIEAEDNPEIQLIEEEKGHDHGENNEAVGTIQDNQLLRFSEEEDSDENDEYADEEEMAEKVEESSEETGDSSMESNAEAIWPLESIEELSQQLKEESKTNIQKLEEKIDEYRTGETEERGCHASINNEGIYANGNYKIEDTVQSRISPMKELLMRINVSTDRSNMGIWISSAAVLLLLVVGPLLLSFANIVKLCLIVFLLVMILSHIWELP
ncbi:uncharacterized protein LOC131304692 [Rhododendron vialii]|uniref:uncharacterized protein LOC131304692 n=1 Tax=Rhododendron vialii TaxID=182163 RepID=UPI00265DBC59|nr:uncharacterized protein LOC131304692 [Rhododendron vialii]